MVSSQERRAVSSGGQNGRQPVVNRWFGFSIGLHMFSLVRASGDVQDSCVRCPGGYTTGRMAIFDPIFGSGDRGCGRVRRSSESKIEDKGGSSLLGVEDRRLKITGVLRFSGSEDRGRGFFDLRSRTIEEPPFRPRSLGPEDRRTRPSSSIFGAEDRRTPPYLQSSIFCPEDRRTPLILSSIFCPEEWVEDRR